MKLVIKTHHTRWPVLQGLLPISRSEVTNDIVAGVTLAALAIPKVMGYTRISGTPVITGLYTILIPTALFALFGSSRHLVVGADSATAAILAGGLVGLATPGSAHWLGLAGVLAIMVAVLLTAARVVRLGFLADFLSRTVLIGFLTGVGVQVAIGATSGMLGLPGGGHDVVGAITSDLRQIREISAPDLVVALAVLAVILGSRRISRKVPGALIAVVGSIVVSWVFEIGAHGVKVLGAVPSGLPRLGPPGADFSIPLLEKLLPTAIAMVVVILAQSAATSRAYAARHTEAFSEDVDLIGLALANFGAGLSGTFAVNGSPTKTQMVESAGGRSQLSQVTTSLIVLVVLLFLTKPLAYMPQAVLAAVVFLIGVELIDYKGMRQILQQRRSEFWVALVTAGVVVLWGVEQGIILAMALSLLVHVRLGYRPKNAIIALDPSAESHAGGDPGQHASETWRTLPVATMAEIQPGLLVYRFNHSMYYANSEQLSQQVLALAKQARPALSWLCIDAAAVEDVDFTAAATLRSLHGVLHKAGIRLLAAEVSESVAAELDRYGLTALLGRDAFFRTVGDVVRAFRLRTKVTS